MAEQLRYISESRMCLAYPLGATRASLDDGERIPVGIHEYIARCAMLGIERDFADKEHIPFNDLKLRSANSSGACVSPIQTSSGRTAVRARGGFGADSLRRVGQSFSGLGLLASVRGAAAKPTPNMEELHMRRLALLIEWGQAEMVEAELQAVQEQSGGLVPKPLLNQLLHLALVHNQADITAAALRRGASLDWYYPDNNATGVPPTWYGWRELLESASDEPKERYLLTLREQARRELEPGASEDRIKDDAEAVAILNEVYLGVVMADGSGVGSRARAPAELCFTHEAGGAWGGGDSNLFLFAVLVNRLDLARLFFARDAGHNAEEALGNALWACLLSRRLRELPDVGRLSYNLCNGFDTTASHFEDVAASVLRTAFEQSDRFALGALELQLKLCQEWTALDLVVKANCREVITKCPELCIAAVQRRFYGEGGFRAAVRRMTTALRGVLKFIMTGVDETVPVSEVVQERIVQIGEGEPHQDDRQSQEQRLPVGPKANLLLLAQCILVDLVGASYYLLPLLPGALYTIVWSPVCAWLVFRLLKDPCIALLVLLEECLPLISLVPTATIGWALQQQDESGNEQGCDYSEEDQKLEVDSPFVPVDHFVMDVLMHCLPDDGAPLPS
jgi:hypothetical protein